MPGKGALCGDLDEGMKGCHRIQIKTAHHDDNDKAHDE